jgi:hypothetical protein
VEDEMAAWAARPPLAAAVARLGCYRGIALLNGLTLAVEVGDWRRFPAARAFMSMPDRHDKPTSPVGSANLSAADGSERGQRCRGLVHGGQHACEVGWLRS